MRRRQGIVLAGEEAAAEEVDWTSAFELRFGCQRTVVARHAGAVVLEMTRDANAVEGGRRLVRDGIAGTRVLVQVWESPGGERLHTLSNGLVAAEHEASFIAWQRQTCKGWQGETLAKVTLRGGLPPELAEAGCEGAWSPEIHRMLPRQARDEIRAVFWLFYRLLGRDVLRHVLFPFVAFRRGPPVRLFISGDLTKTVGGTTVWKEIAVLNARVPPDRVMSAEEPHLV